MYKVHTQMGQHETRTADHYYCVKWIVLKNGWHLHIGFTKTHGLQKHWYN